MCMQLTVGTHLVSTRSDDPGDNVAALGRSPALCPSSQTLPTTGPRWPPAEADELGPDAALRAPLPPARAPIPTTNASATLDRSAQRNTARRPRRLVRPKRLMPSALLCGGACVLSRFLLGGLAVDEQHDVALACVRVSGLSGTAAAAAAPEENVICWHRRLSISQNAWQSRRTWFAAPHVATIQALPNRTCSTDGQHLGSPDNQYV